MLFKDLAGRREEADAELLERFVLFFILIVGMEC